jgi:hypothetical protein
MMSHVLQVEGNEISFFDDGVSKLESGANERAELVIAANRADTDRRLLRYISPSVT